MCVRLFHRTQEHRKHAAILLIRLLYSFHWQSTVYFHYIIISTISITAEIDCEWQINWAVAFLIDSIASRRLFMQCINEVTNNTIPIQLNWNEKYKYYKNINIASMHLIVHFTFVFIFSLCFGYELSVYLIHTQFSNIFPWRIYIIFIDEGIKSSIQHESINTMGIHQTPHPWSHDECVNHIPNRILSMVQLFIHSTDIVCLCCFSY